MAAITSVFKLSMIIVLCAIPASKSDEDRIRFPKGFNSAQAKQPPRPSEIFTANVKRCAVNNQTFCTQDSTYPSEFIQQMLAQSNDKLSIWFRDTIPTDMSVVDRFDSDEIELCSTETMHNYPVSATNTEGKDLYIVNVVNHTQVVTTSKCASKACDAIVTVPIGYRTECIQQSVLIQLISLSPEGQPMKDVFPFPATCACSAFRN